MDALFCNMDERQNTDITLFAVGLVAQLGFMIAVPVVLFALAGIAADRALGTGPIFLLLGLCLAGVSSAVWVLRQAQRMKIRYLALFASKEKPPPPPI